MYFFSLSLGRSVDLLSFPVLFGYSGEPRRMGH